MTQEVGLVFPEIKSPLGPFESSYPNYSVSGGDPHRQEAGIAWFPRQSVTLQLAEGSSIWLCVVFSFRTALPGGTASGCISGQGRQTESAGASGRGSPKAASRWNASSEPALRLRESPREGQHKELHSVIRAISFILWGFGVPTLIPGPCGRSCTLLSSSRGHFPACFPGRWGPMRLEPE